MTRSLGFVSITSAVCLLAGLARGSEPTPDQIISEALRAHGGEERLNQLTGFQLKERWVFEKGPDLSFEVVTDLPHRYRSETRNGPEGKTMSTVVFDGDQAWMKMGSSATESYGSSFVKTMRSNIIPFAGPRSVLRLRARQKNPLCRMETVGESISEGHQALGLRMTLEDGPQETWFFDKNTGLLLKTESVTARFEGEDTKSVSYYEDYQTVEGFPIARKVTNLQDGKTTSTQHLIDFKVATPSEGLFAKP
jgi:hypothetical protein